MIIDNVIDYLHLNFRDLSPGKRLQGGQLLIQQSGRKGSQDRADLTTEIENEDVYKATAAAAEKTPAVLSTKAAMA